MKKKQIAFKYAKHRQSNFPKRKEKKSIKTVSNGNWFLNLRQHIFYFNLTQDFFFSTKEPLSYIQMYLRHM